MHHWMHDNTEMGCVLEGPLGKTKNFGVEALPLRTSVGEPPRVGKRLNEGMNEEFPEEYE